MSDYLQTTVDKFTFRIATDRLYTREGVWLLPISGQRVRVGVTDYFQQHNGDVAFVNVKAAGTRLAAGIRTMMGRYQIFPSDPLVIKGSL